MPNDKTTIRLLIAISVRHGYQRDTIEGITQYCHRHPGWTLLHDLDAEPSVELLRHMAGKFDAVIAECYDKTFLEELAGLRQPTVLVNQLQHTPCPLPSCWVDITRATEMAVEHFQDLGFRDFTAFHLHFPSRADLFHRAVVARGGRFHPCPEIDPDPANREEMRPHMDAWLQRLPKPIGVLGANITAARYLVTTATECGFQVPDDLAVLALGYDSLLSQLTEPPLSTIDLNNRQVGFEATRIVWDLLHGRAGSGIEVPIEPKGVIQRQSTDTHAIDDPTTLDALQYIRENAVHGATVNDVLRAVPVSRSTLERNLRRYLTRSIHGQILHVRLQQARDMLRNTDLPVVDIAHRCGFGHRSRLHEQFRRRFGQTPHQFRRQNPS